MTWKNFLPPLPKTFINDCSRSATYMQSLRQGFQHRELSGERKSERRMEQEKS